MAKLLPFSLAGLTVFLGGCGDVPPRAVVSFALPECPAGWELYKPAEGVFIRGMDNGDSPYEPLDANKKPIPFDPGRKLEGYEADKVGPHSHDYQLVVHNAAGKSGTEPLDMPHDPETARTVALHQADNPNLPNDVNANETRPRNIALLYCIKR